ncbi:MAG: tetratricopeptide repeat protein [Calditrichaeota bacterium]|nr:tetratricopeptide repeat protein [Calditrichota bacterium]
MSSFRNLFLITFLIISNTLFVSAQYKDAGNEFSYALKLYDQKFYDLAAQQFIKYYNSYQGSPNAAEAKFYAGLSLFKLEQFSNARVEFQSLALEYPKHQKAGESWFKIGECYERLEKYADAAKSFETLKTLYPNNPMAAEALYKAGHNYNTVKDYQKGKSVLAAILDRYTASPFYYKALLELALIYHQIDKPQQARMYLEKIIQNSSNKNELAQAYYTNGLINLEQGYSNVSIEAFTKVTKDYSNSEFYAKSAFYLGKLYLQNNNYNHAIEYFGKAEDENSDLKLKNSITILKGDAFYLSKKYALAEKAYKNVSEFESDSAKYVLNLKKALSLKKQGLTRKALNALSELINSTPSNSSTAFKTIYVYLDWSIAAKDYNQAISLILQKLKTELKSDEQFLLLDKLGYTYWEARRWRDLVRELGPYVNTPNLTSFKDDFLFYLATAYYNLGEFEESAHYYEVLIKQFSASKHYQKSSEYHKHLVDYKLIDQGKALRTLAAIVAKDSPSKEIPLGKFYFNDLKDYQSARLQFEKAVSTEPSQIGDAHLYLGKSILKLADMPGKSEGEQQQLLKKASQNFQLAVENLATCSAPDEASWLMVRTGIAVDTISIIKQKKYIETLIAKYKNSTLQETWLYTLANDLAFEPKYEEDSRNNFQKLIKNYKKSENYSSYIYGYAKLLVNKDLEKAISLFKTIALEHSNTPEAVLSLYEVARYYEENRKYKEAVQLYSLLLDQFYYSDLAENADNKVGELNLKSGLYEETILSLKEKVNDPFINDIVLSREYLNADATNNLVYMGIASRRIKENQRAQDYFKRYQTLSPNGLLKNVVSFELGELYFHQGRKNLALESFRNISKKDSSLYNQALLYSANILFDDQKYSEAAKAYQQLDKLYENKSQQKDIQGKFIISKIKTGAISESEKLIKTYKKKFSNEKEMLASFTIEMGEFQRKNKNYDKAIRYYKTVKSKYDNTSKVDDADYFTALTYVTLNKNEEAFDILTNFYKNYSKSDKLPAVLNTLGTLYFRVEKYDNAISAFKNALQKSTDTYLSGQIMGNLIKTYTLTGFWDAAQGLARQYVEEYPDAEDILDKKMIIAQAFTNLNQFQNAVDYLKRMKLEADSEKEPEIQFYIGEALLKAGRYEEAIAEFVKIPLLSKKTKLQWEASALYYSGQAYEKLGRVPDAVRMYREIISRPGIDLILKRDAEKRITQIQG